MRQSEKNDKQKKGLLYQVKTFAYAFAGLRFFFSHEVKSGIHLVAAIITVAVGLFFHLSLPEWIIITLCIGLVFCMEIVNTAIEALVDMVSPEKKMAAGRIKDLSAAAVFVALCCAFIAGLLIFVPKIVRLLTGA
jgi:diacylglycerol kinase